jgi:hypothetical protein
MRSCQREGRKKGWKQSLETQHLLSQSCKQQIRKSTSFDTLWTKATISPALPRDILWVATQWLDRLWFSSVWSPLISFCNCPNLDPCRRIQKGKGEEEIRLMSTMPLKSVCLEDNWSHCVWYSLTTSPLCSVPQMGEMWGLKEKVKLSFYKFYLP